MEKSRNEEINKFNNFSNTKNARALKFERCIWWSDSKYGRSKTERRMSIKEMKWKEKKRKEKNE